MFNTIRLIQSIMNSPSIGMEVVERIANREGVDPIDLDVRLYDVIDPDALEVIANGTHERQPEATLRVEFTYYGHDVTVLGGGSVLIDEQPPEPDSDETSSKSSGAA